MSDDMSDMIKKMSEMLNSNEIPDNIKSIINNFASSSNSSNANSNVSANSDINNNSSNNGFSTNATDSNSSPSDMPNIDMNTMFKMKSIIDSMNSQNNDPRSNLLRSLKPYLKPSRKEKVDQYIKLFNMGKAFEILNPLGVDNKNDV